MKKNIPLLKFLLGVNFIIFGMLNFFIYFDVKSPGMHGLSLEKTVWSPTSLMTLFFLTHASISIFVIVSAQHSTKSISDLKSRFMKSSKFKFLDKNRLIAHLESEQYLAKDDFYFKNLNEKNTSKILFKLSSNYVEIRLDNQSVINFQMDKRYCEEIHKFRTSCADALGEEILK